MVRAVCRSWMHEICRQVSLAALSLSKGVFLLQEALTLLAYQAPANSPVRHLFDVEARERCASVANTAMMQQRGVSDGNTLQQLCQQAAVVHEELAQRDCIEARLLHLDHVYARDPT